MTDGSNNPLAGSVVVVTGATGGVGRATCRRLARDGAVVWAVDLVPDRLDELVGGLDGTGHRAWPLDLNDLSGQQVLAEALAAEPRAVTGLVHLAAVIRRRNRIEDVTEEDWDAQIDTNLKATFFLNRFVAGVLIDRGRGGSMVNCVSQGWWTGGFGGSVVYSASKGGVVSMSRGLARWLAPHNIRVNTVAPGFVDTDMMRMQTPEQIAASVAQVPLGRMAEPAELADAIAFLIGPDSRYMTGATLNLTGGQLMY